ncbi:MAG: peptide-methionine (S)-S-oxide reductase MsrA [Methanosarcinales archaeon]|nr:peptide-methionine (S)-S-oxide reductase MsrA [ANME-2 cluster archaeon]MDW7775252.1 peptide-methionine (S)-S-oxide reductase MsrA [Methanosarcinales archaeon]
MNQVNQTATLGGGCFWCLEAIFDNLRGVEKVISGYSGGSVPAPSYREVCTGNTGHAEVIQITFDHRTISFKELLEVFLTVHDPTTFNRQGPDVGTQYRSVIFYHTSEQHEVAREAIAEFGAKKIWDRPIVTEITPFEAFYPAEEEHQKYFMRNPGNQYCSLVIAPKVAKFRKYYISRLKT